MNKRTPTPADVQADRAQAMLEYQNELHAVRERTEKLRAERLAREAAATAAPAKKPKKKG